MLSASSPSPAMRPTAASTGRSRGRAPRAAVAQALALLRADPRVASIVSPLDGTAADPSALISRDRHAVAVDVATKDELAVARDYYPELRAKVRSDRLTVSATGVLAITNGFNDVLQDDLRRAETRSEERRVGKECRTGGGGDN